MLKFWGLHSNLLVYHPPSFLIWTLSPPDCPLSSLCTLSFSCNEPCVVSLKFHAVPCLGAFKVQLKNGLLWEAIPNRLLRTALDLDTSLPCSSPLYHCYYHSGMYTVWTCPSPLPEYKPTKGRDFILLYFPSPMASQCLQHGRHLRTSAE